MEENVSIIKKSHSQLFLFFFLPGAILNSFCTGIIEFSLCVAARHHLHLKNTTGYCLRTPSSPSCALYIFLSKYLWLPCHIPNTWTVNLVCLKDAWQGHSWVFRMLVEADAYKCNYSFYYTASSYVSSLKYYTKKSISACHIQFLYFPFMKVTWKTVSNDWGKLSNVLRRVSSKLNFPPNSCMPSKLKIMMNRKSSSSREAMERTEFSKEATRLLREFQYLSSSAEQCQFTATSE